MAATMLTMREAAEYAGCSTKTLQRRIREGKLRAQRSGRLIRIKTDDLEAMFTPTDQWIR